MTHISILNPLSLSWVSDWMSVMSILDKLTPLKPISHLQGYVTEIMLTLMAAVDGINEDFRPMDFVKELFLSTPNLNKEPRLEIRKSATVALRQNPPHHYRSTSYSLSALTGRKAVVSGPPNMTDVKGRYSWTYLNFKVVFTCQGYFSLAIGKNMDVCVKHVSHM